MRIINTIKETCADGPGIRYSIYVSGCTNHCPGCHNPQTWDFNQGYELTDVLKEQIKKEIIEDPLIDGITISGGDPMHPENVIGLADLLDDLIITDKNIWVYTGYNFEDLFYRDELTRYVLSLIDVLVDGPFVQELRDYDNFRGSINQRFIDVKKTLAENKKNGFVKVFEINY